MASSASPCEIAVAALRPHPQNPRLEPRQDVVDQLAAQISARGSLDPAHALIVRPLGDAYEIVSGHHRKLAAEVAGLATVPCWVRELADDEAYMALVLANTQGELHPLEEGLHALGSGMSVKDYAAQVAKPSTTLQTKAQAGRVLEAVKTHVSFTDLRDRWRCLAEIHAAPPWLWPAMAGSCGRRIELEQADAASPALIAVHRLRRLATVLAAGDRDAAWLADRLRAYLDDAATGVRLEEVLGLATPPGGRPWWRVEATACRDRLLRRLAELQPGATPTARVNALLHKLRRYAATGWRHDQRRHDLLPQSHERRLLAEVFALDPSPPTSFRALYSIVTEPIAESSGFSLQPAPPILGAGNDAAG